MDDFYPELSEFEPPARRQIRLKKRKKSTIKSINHFMRIISLEKEQSISRNTYSEIMNIRLKRLKSAIDPRELLSEIFESMIGRLSQNFEKGFPRILITLK